MDSDVWRLYGPLISFFSNGNVEDLIDYSSTWDSVEQEYISILLREFTSGGILSQI